MKVKVLKIRISDKFQNLDEAVVNDYLDRYEVIDLNAQMVDDGDVRYWSVFINYEEKLEKPVSDKTSSESKLTAEEKVIFEKLKNWRTVKARESHLPPYVIFHNSHLVSIAQHKPSTLEDLKNVDGLGQSKIEKFGAEIIKVLENA